MTGRLLESSNIVPVLVIILKCLLPKDTTNINQVIMTAKLRRPNPRETDGNN